MPLLHVADKSYFSDHEDATDRITRGDTAWTFRGASHTPLNQSAKHWYTEMHS